MIWQRRVNVYFGRKMVSLYSNIRLLGRDEWGKPPFWASIGLRIFSIKTTKRRKAKQKIIELPLCVKKGLVACRDAAWEFFCIWMKESIKDNAEERRFSLESRRYIGCKTKLVDWIFSLINEQTHDVHSFCDIFAGTGVVAHRALQTYERVVVNDFLHSNNVMYRAFFAPTEWDEERVQTIIEEFNSINPNKVRENYFSP